MNAQAEKTAIEIGKTKLIFSFFASLAFVVVSILFVSDPKKYVSPIISSKGILILVGILGIMTFGFFGIMILKKIFDKGKGLIISKDGIYDNSTAMSVGLIEWNDIVGIKRYQVMFTKFLVIIVDKPDKYIERGKNPLAKSTMRSNLKICGSPITIAPNALKINFKNLENVLVENFESYKIQNNQY